jgi:hypothetical protein
VGLSDLRTLGSCGMNNRTPAFSMHVAAVVMSSDSLFRIDLAQMRTSVCVRGNRAYNRNGTPSIH